MLVRPDAGIALGRLQVERSPPLTRPRCCRGLRPTPGPAERAEGTDHEMGSFTRGDLYHVDGIKKKKKVA